MDSCFHFHVFVGSPSPKSLCFWPKGMPCLWGAVELHMEGMVLIWGHTEMKVMHCLSGCHLWRQFSMDLTYMSVMWNSCLGVWCNCTKLIVHIIVLPLFSTKESFSVCLTICTCEYPYFTEVLPGSLFSNVWPVHPNCLDCTGTLDRQSSRI